MTSPSHTHADPWAFGVGVLGGIPIGLWFAWKRRHGDRRGEIGWFALAALATFAVLVPR